MTRSEIADRFLALPDLGGSSPRSPTSTFPLGIDDQDDAAATWLSTLIAPNRSEPVGRSGSTKSLLASRMGV